MVHFWIAARPHLLPHKAIFGILFLFPLPLFGAGTATICNSVVLFACTPHWKPLDSVVLCARGPSEWRSLDSVI